MEFIDPTTPVPHRTRAWDKKIGVPEPVLESLYQASRELSRFVSSDPIDPGKDRTKNKEKWLAVVQGETSALIDEAIHTIKENHDSLGKLQEKKTQLEKENEELKSIVLEPLTAFTGWDQTNSSPSVWTCFLFLLFGFLLSERNMAARVVTFLMPTSKVCCQVHSVFLWAITGTRFATLCTLVLFNTRMLSLPPILERWAFSFFPLLGAIALALCAETNMAHAALPLGFTCPVPAVSFYTPITMGWLFTLFVGLASALQVFVAPHMVRAKTQTRKIFAAVLYLGGNLLLEAGGHAVLDHPYDAAEQFNFPGVNEFTHAFLHTLKESFPMVFCMGAVLAAHEVYTDLHYHNHLQTATMTKPTARAMTGAA